MTTLKDLSKGLGNPFKSTEKGTSYALTQTLNQGAYTFALNEETGVTQIGLWLGDEYIGFFCDGTITFNLASNLNTNDLIIKSLSEGGEVKRVKLEKGSVAHKWTPAPEDKTGTDEIRLFDYVRVISDAHNINTLALITKLSIDLLNPQNNTFNFGFNHQSLTDKYTEADNALKRIEADYVKSETIADVRNNITSLSSEIQQTAEQIRTEVSEKYVSTGAMDEFRSEVSTQFTQTSTDYTYLFTQLETYVQTLDGDTQAQFNEIVKYIRFIDGKIVLGEINNPLILEIQNNRISFKQNGAEVAYISDNTLYITDGRFLNSLRIGEFMFKPRSNGSLSFGKAGD